MYFCFTYNFFESAFESCYTLMEQADLFIKAQKGESIMNKSEFKAENPDSSENMATDWQHLQESKKNPKPCIIIFIIAVILLILGIIAVVFLGGITYKIAATTNVSSTTTPISNELHVSEDASKENHSNNTGEEKQTPKDNSSNEYYQIDLSAGQYKAGTDIPAGTYELTVTSGSGNVSTDLSKDGLNEVIGAEADGYSNQSLSNVKLIKGTTLSIGGDLVLHCVSEAADLENLIERTSVEAQTFDLQEGDYTAGKEFPAGTYHIIATGVSGNVSSSNLYEGGLNEIMGTDGFGIKQYNNAIFQEGTTLNISGTSVQLVYIGK